jgi:tetratricopeptide (TPR) repeat protein
MTQPPQRLRKRRPLSVAVALLAAGLTAAYLGATAWANHHARAAATALDQLRFDDARWHAEKALGVRSGDADLHLTAARAARRGGDPEAAARHLGECKRIGGVTPALTREYDLLRTEQGDVSGSGAAVRGGSPGPPDDVPALESLAQGYLVTDQPAAAVACLDALERHCPDHPRAAVWRARAWGKLNQRGRALADARRGVDLRPASEEARRELADALDHTGHTAEAASQYEWLLARRPGDAGVVVRLARCRQDLAELGEARRLLDDILAGQPGHAGALAERGRLALREGDADRAVDVLRRAVALVPGDLDVHRLLVAALEAAGRSGEARHAGEGLRELEAEAGRVERLTAAVRSNPRDPAPCAELGVYLAAHGREREGLIWLARALELDPHYAPARTALDDHARRRGQRPGERRDP